MGRRRRGAQVGAGRPTGTQGTARGRGERWEEALPGTEGRALKPGKAREGRPRWPSPHFRERLGAAAAASSQRCQPAGPGPRSAVSAQPGGSPTARASRASPFGDGGVRAATARRDHGGTGLRQGHRVVAHHQTLRAEAPLQRGSAPKQHTSGHRWELGLQRCSALRAEGPGRGIRVPGMRVLGRGCSICFRLPRGETPGC